MIDLTTEDIFKNRNLFRINHYSPSILKKAYICLLSGKPFFFSMNKSFTSKLPRD